MNAHDLRRQLRALGLTKIVAATTCRTWGTLALRYFFTARVSARILFISWLLMTGSAAWACPTCGCGNPAITPMGAEQAFVNRVRVATTLRLWQQDSGTARLNANRLREARLDLTGAWAPTNWFWLVVNVPLQVRELQTVSLAKETAWGPGEIELTARAVVLGAGQMRPKALISVFAGARLPTAPTISDAKRVPLSLDSQLGPGAFAPQLGVSWGGFFTERWSALVSVVGEIPTTGRFGFRAGPVLSVTGLGQFQPLRWLGFRAGVETRLEAESFTDGVADASSAGFLGSISADAVVSPTSRVVVLLGARVPVIDTRTGPMHSWPIVLSSVVVDL